MQFLLRIPQHIGNGINCGRTPHQIEDIAELQADIATGDQFDPGTVQARDNNVIAFFKVQVANTFSEHVFIGDHHTLDAQISAFRGQRSIDLLTNHQLRIM